MGKQYEKMLIAGIDEAGRGSLISRVYTAAVILPDNFLEQADDAGIVIRDSKKMTRIQRNRARLFIESHAIAYCVAWSEQEEIDRMNILRATLSAMKKSLDGLQVIPDMIHVDGNVFETYVSSDGFCIPHRCIVRGDATDPAISCAGILAKTFRDEYIINLVESNPELQKYHISKNMGYGTADHIRALKEHGMSSFHRKSFHIRKCRTRLLSAVITTTRSV